MARLWTPPLNGEVVTPTTNPFDMALLAQHGIEHLQPDADAMIIAAQAACDELNATGGAALDDEELKAITAGALLPNLEDTSQLIKPSVVVGIEGKFRMFRPLNLVARGLGIAIGVEVATRRMYPFAHPERADYTTEPSFVMIGGARRIEY